jgi:hypothetical protein
MNAKLERLLSWRPHVIVNGDPRAAFNIAADAARPGVRTFHAFGVTLKWAFVGVIVCVHSPYDEPKRSKTHHTASCIYWLNKAECNCGAVARERTL